MVADTRVEAHAFDDLAGIQAQTLCIAVQLVEVGHAHCQIGISEELDCLGFGGVSEQYRNIFLDCSFLQQCGEALRTLRTLTDHDTGWMQVIV